MWILNKLRLIDITNTIKINKLKKVKEKEVARYRNFCK